MNNGAISVISAMDIRIYNILVPVSNENTNCDVRIKIFRFFNKFLHESLSLFYTKLLMTYRKVFVVYYENTSVGKILGFLMLKASSAYNKH